jgi:hypothetical protein
VDHNVGVQEVPSSNLGGPTKFFLDLQIPTLTTLLARTKNYVPIRGASLTLEKPAIPDIFSVSH